MQSIQLPETKKEFEVKDASGERLGTFVFSPSDTGILTRYEEVRDFFDNMENVQAETPGAAMRKLETIAKEKFDYLLDADSGIFFEKVRPFTLLPSGETYFEVILSTVGAVIESEMKERVKKMGARTRKLRKATAKYHPEAGGEK